MRRQFRSRSRMFCRQVQIVNPIANLHQALRARAQLCAYCPGRHQSCHGSCASSPASSMPTRGPRCTTASATCIPADASSPATHPGCAGPQASAGPAAAPVHRRGGGRTCGHQPGDPESGELTAASYALEADAECCPAAGTTLTSCRPTLATHGRTWQHSPKSPHGCRGLL